MKIFTQIYSVILIVYCLLSTPLSAQNISTFAGDGTQAYGGDGVAATAAQLWTPQGVVSDPSGNIYIGDFYNSAIRQVSFSTGIITTVAGDGTAGTSGDGSSAISAQLNEPWGVTVDASGNIYFADYFNHVIRKVDASTGNISRVAGNYTSGFSGDGASAISAQLYFPSGVALDASGNIYIADGGNGRIRKVTVSTGIITTVAGTTSTGYNGDNIAATSAKLSSSANIGVALDASGNIYIADEYNHRIRKVTVSTGIITTVAGNGTFGFSGDGGAATSAQLYWPEAVTIDGSGNIYIADYNNNRIRKVTVSTGIISTVAGTGTAGYNGDGIAATTAQLNYPTGMIVANGYLYIADAGNNRIRQVAVSLPIELLSFTAKPIENKYLLAEWTTASEVNSDYFTVERAAPSNLPAGQAGSPEGGELKWEFVGTVKAAGNSTTTLNYNFMDYTPFPSGSPPVGRTGVGDGLLYYRLKQTDFNGDFKYYGPVAVVLEGIDIIDIHPNPAVDHIDYVAVSSFTDKITFSLIDVLGRKVIGETKEIQIGENKFGLDISTYPQGMYMLQLITETGKYQTQKQFIVK